MRLPRPDELDDIQREVVEMAPEARVLVTGGPGTGKTVVALHRAHRLSGDGRVQVLVFSKLLSQFIDSASRELAVDTSTYHSWFWHFFQHYYRRKPPQVEDYVFDWPAALEIINSKPLPAARLPYLIVDEGQDLPKEMYLVLQAISGGMTIFADENQRIGDRQSTVAEIMTHAGIVERRHLLLNMRNTRAIATAARGLQIGEEEWGLPAGDGQQPVLVHYDSIAAAARCIGRFAESHKEQTIGVFAPSSQVQRELTRLIRHHTSTTVQMYARMPGVSEMPQLAFDAPIVTVATHLSAKGLEFDAVFLPELQWVDYISTTADVQMLFHVLLSRARETLALSFSGDESPPILELFDPRRIAREPCCNSIGTPPLKACRHCGHENGPERSICARCRNPIP